MLGMVAATLWYPDNDFMHTFEKSVFSALNTLHAANQCFDGTLNALHHVAFAASKENNESYTYNQMFNQPDVADIVEVMQKEVDNHETIKHWEVIPRWKMPSDPKNIMSFWSFKRKKIS